MRRGEAIWHEANHCVFNRDPSDERSDMLLLLTAVPDGIAVETHKCGTMCWKSAEILRDWLDAMLKDDTNDKETA